MSVITKKHGTLEYLAAEGITVPHCFTTRFGGVSEGYLSSLNIGMHRGDDPKNVEENFRILGNALGFSLADIALTQQIHTDIVRRSTSRHIATARSLSPATPSRQLRQRTCERSKP